MEYECAFLTFFTLLVSGFYYKTRFLPKTFLKYLRHLHKATKFLKSRSDRQAGAKLQRWQ